MEMLNINSLLYFYKLVELAWSGQGCRFPITQIISVELFFIMNKYQIITDYYLFLTSRLFQDYNTLLVMSKRVLLLGLVLWVVSSAVIKATAAEAGSAALQPVNQLRRAAGPQQLSSCDGYSEWFLEEYGQGDDAIYFKFQGSLDKNFECKHYFTIDSRCTIYQVTYTTIHCWNCCPLFYLDEITIPYTALSGCPSTNRADDEKLIVDEYSSLPGQQGYCLTLLKHGATISDWDDSTQQRVLDWGKHRAHPVTWPQQVWWG